MVRYPARAAGALGFLKRRNNDIEIFIEDTSNRAMWMNILKRSLPAGTALRSVNMMGGRDRVVEACRLNQTDDGRKKLFIIDGDYDFLLGKAKPRLKYLYRLNAYCVENLFIDEKCAALVAADAMLTDDERHAKATIGFSQELETIEELMIPLFVRYATVFELERSIQTVGYPVMSLLSAVSGVHALDPKKVKARKFELLERALATVDVAKFRKEHRRIAQRAKSLKLKNIVSGKDYLLPVIWLKLKSTAQYKGTIEQLKVHLSKNFRPGLEPGLMKKISQVLR